MLVTVPIRDGSGAVEKPRSFWEDPDNIERFANRPPDERLLGILPSYKEPGRIRVLDLGCAGGRNTVVLAERGFDFYAVDASQAMVKHTIERVAAVIGETEAKRRVTRGFMDNLQPFGSESFDLVVALGIYHSAECRAEWEKALDETARVLAAGGTLLTANFSPQSDPKGDGLRPVAGEPNVYEGFDPGPTFLLDASDLDTEFGRRGLHPIAPTQTVKTATETGHRVTVNGVFRKRLLHESI
jgi:SAM-dependent methyltransferase